MRPNPIPVHETESHICVRHRTLGEKRQEGMGHLGDVASFQGDPYQRRAADHGCAGVAMPKEQRYNGFC